MLGNMSLSTTQTTTTILTYNPRLHSLSTSSPSSFNAIRMPSRATSFLSVQQQQEQRASSVITMAKKDDELKEIRELTNEEINDEVVKLKGELFMLRLKKSARDEFKASEFGRMRKRIARMLTVKREREISEGINKRISRKLDREWKQTIVLTPPASMKKLQEKEAETAS